ncbi:MAG: helicase C-terminal domain-containing protein [Candidatus Omnitrophota bacterium]
MKPATVIRGFIRKYSREKMELTDIFKEDGLIAKHLVSYEFRIQQIQMANAVAEAIQSNQHLLVEAGTGVGKSLAYLVPFIQWCTRLNKKVIISTYTKTLQEQLVNKDLPFLRRVLGIDVKFALCMGGQNYLCLRRFQQSQNHDLFETGRELSQIQQIGRWLEATESGLYSDLDFEPGESTWSKICREGDLCLGRKCAHRKGCFYQKARAKLEKADILVVNHHLFFANLVSGGRVLPNVEAVVFDEAHTLENVATEYLGVEVTNFKIKYFLDSIFNPQSGKGFLNRIAKINRDKAKDIRSAQDGVRIAAQRFFSEVVSKLGKESRVQRIRARDFVFNHLKDPLLNLCSLLAEALDEITDPEDRVQVKSYLSRGKGMAAGIEAIINQSLEGYVYWIEILAGPRRPKYSLYAAPVDISREFKQKILDEFNLIIFTSATLSTNGNFDFIKSALGIEGATELLLASPFDYNSQALVYIPKTLPDPNREFEAYQKAAIEEIKRILGVMEGGAFVLFTSYKMLDMADNILKQELSDFNILRQGDIPRYKLLEKFKAGHHTVLLGTDTFWQGVDVPGRALECVIITKLPFAVPDNPVIEAKMELLRAQNKDPFIHYQIPQAIIMFRQGFGRLIRTKTDIGMVAILDPRIKTRFYGKSFLDALPKCQQVSRLEDVKEFFEQ